ncbi:heterokaryon incompatibility protein 6, OR allele [Colletotrichum spaethianum]|uniref:Heterokaryon incompatibility protein 6, OR allele n=1 Tax=Colletotrichum spaethianum TaxID=700344 RepID=A0AA37P0B1_9PEZI|nr:heterokaryon incompatibility protein 6, OR allele [Colletotrichum spaethianum]GKT45365.1 heterokaryon incompatibility protein 6, OR allele [Colletotrichum spaethianum]
MPLSQDRREIRLVRLRPLPGLELKTDNKISLEIRHVSLDDDDVTYSALSYVWGDAGDTLTVDIDGVSFAVTRNLHAALQQLARNGVDSWLWIDAVCIAQANLGEKGWQINAMRNIFSGAEMVYMWLGPGCRESDAAMDFILRVGPALNETDIRSRVRSQHLGLRTITSYISSRFSSQGEPFTPTLESSSDSVDIGSISTEVEQNTSPDDVQEINSEMKLAVYELLCDFFSQKTPPLQIGINNILQREYWHRIWIIQEVTLAWEAVVVVGTRSVSLDVFDTAFTALWEFLPCIKLKRTAWSFFEGGMSRALYPTKSLAVRNSWKAGVDVRLADIIWRVGAGPGRPHYSASDPRDIAFGLLGVLRADEMGYLQADYSLSIEEVFIQVTAALLNNPERSGFFLDCVQPGDLSGILPTWVPDWRDIGQYGRGTYPISYVISFEAAVKKTQQRAFTDAVRRDGTFSVCLSGCWIDEVTEVMEAPVWLQYSHYEASQLEDPDAWARSVIAFTGLNPKYGGPEDDHVWRTLTCGECDLPHDSRSRPFKDELNRLRPRMMRVQRVDAATLTTEEAAFVRQYFNGGIEKGSAVRVPVDDEELDVFATRWRRSIGSRTRNRVLFKTAQGMLGLGHDVVKVGDVVTLIWGTRSPIVLRKRSEGGFFFRGDAYIDGLMRGEYLSTEPEEKEFVLY